MRARLLADADLRLAIVQGFERREPFADFMTAQGTIADSTIDLDVLAVAAQLGRVLVSHNWATLPPSFLRFIKSRQSPGLVLISQKCGTDRAVEELRMVWLCQEASGFRNEIVYLPL